MPTGHPFEITPEVLERIEHYGSLGLTQTQIAHNLGINESTLTRKKGSDEQVAQAIKRGLDRGIQEVTNALKDNAMSGNLGAQCFYLKNRAPDSWSDRQDIHHSGNVGFDVIDYTGDSDAEAETT